VSVLYRPRERRLSAKLVPTFADKGCHVVSVTDPYGRILGFLDRTQAYPFLPLPLLLQHIVNRAFLLQSVTLHQTSALLLLSLLAALPPIPFTHPLLPLLFISYFLSQNHQYISLAKNYRLSCGLSIVRYSNEHVV
jgi:hypothetical protein